MMNKEGELMVMKWGEMVGNEERNGYEGYVKRWEF